MVEVCRSMVRVLNKISMGYASMTPINYIYPGGNNSWLHYVMLAGGGRAGPYRGVGL